MLLISETNFMHFLFNFLNLKIITNDRIFYQKQVKLLYVLCAALVTDIPCLQHRKKDLFYLILFEVRVQFLSIAGGKKKQCVQDWLEDITSHISNGHRTFLPTGKAVGPSTNEWISLPAPVSSWHAYE